MFPQHTTVPQGCLQQRQCMGADLFAHIATHHTQSMQQARVEAQSAGRPVVCAAPSLNGSQHEQQVKCLDRATVSYRAYVV